MKIKGTVPDMYIFGLLRTELCRPGVVYDTRQQLIQAIRDMEVKFNDPDHVFNTGLENAFLGSYYSENGRRKGGKLLHIPMLPKLGSPTKNGFANSKFAKLFAKSPFPIVS